MSTLPLKWAPSSKLTRGAFTLPATVLSLRMTTSSSAIMSPSTRPLTSTFFAVTDACATPDFAIVATLFFNVIEPLIVPLISTSPVPEISPVITTPLPIIVRESAPCVVGRDCTDGVGWSGVANASFSCVCTFNAIQSCALCCCHRDAVASTSTAFDQAVVRRRFSGKTML